MRSYKIKYFFVFVDKSYDQGKRKEFMKEIVKKLAESKLVNHRWGIDLSNEINYDLNVEVPSWSDPLGVWHVKFTTDIPDDADATQLMIAFHKLVLDKDYKGIVQVGASGEKMPEYKILSKEEVKANRFTKEQIKEQGRKYFNKRPMKAFIKKMESIFDEKFKEVQPELDLHTA